MHSFHRGENCEGLETGLGLGLGLEIAEGTRGHALARGGKLARGQGDKGNALEALRLG